MFALFPRLVAPILAPLTSRISSSADISGMELDLVLLGGDSGEKMSKS